MPTTRTSLAGLAALAVALVATSAAAASDWPSRPVHVIVPYAAGGPTDLTIRTLAPAASAELRQPVVSNRLGGATMARPRYVVAADPMATPSAWRCAARAQLRARVATLDPQKICSTSSSSSTFRPASSAQSIRPKPAELVSWAKAQETGAVCDRQRRQHASAVVLPCREQAGLPVKHVGYRGWRRR